MVKHKQRTEDCLYYDYSRQRCTLQGMDSKKVKCQGKVKECEA